MTKLEQRLVDRVMSLAAWCTRDKEMLALRMVREIVAAAEDAQYESRRAEEAARAGAALPAEHPDPTYSDEQIAAARDAWPAILPMPSDSELRAIVTAVNRAAYGGSRPALAGSPDLDDLRQLADRWKRMAIERTAGVSIRGIPTPQEVACVKKGGANGLYEAAIDLELLLGRMGVSEGERKP